MLTHLETQIEFKGNTYILIGDMDHGGAIATLDQFNNGDISFAHLYSDGKVMQFGKQIGSREDITVLETKIESRIEDPIKNIIKLLGSY